MNVSVGLRKDGESWKKAELSGLEVLEAADLVKKSDIIMILLLIPVKKRFMIIYQGQSHHRKISSFGHGFNIHYDQIVPNDDINVFMVAQKHQDILYVEHMKKELGFLD